MVICLGQKRALDEVPEMSCPDIAPGPNPEPIDRLPFRLPKNVGQDSLWCVIDRRPWCKLRGFRKERCKRQLPERITHEVQPASLADPVLHLGQLKDRDHVL